MVTYAELIVEYAGRIIPYHKLLSTEEWKRRRAQVVSRQGNVCQHCRKACVDDFINGKPVVLEFYEKEVPFYDPIDDELLGTYTKESMRMIKPKDPLFAQVHHIYYILSRLPWDYADAALLLLCHKCHHYHHQIHRIEVFATEDRMTPVNLAACERCDGTGYLTQYRHVQDGLCFACNGFGSTELV